MTDDPAAARSRPSDELLEALKAEGQKDEWIEMLSQSLRSIVVAIVDDDNWEGSVADAIDAINARFAKFNEEVAALAAARLAQQQELEQIRALCVDAGMTEESTTLDYLRSLFYAVKNKRLGWAAMQLEKARADAAEAAVTALRQELELVLTEAPNPNGEYVHLPWCNGDRRQPPGTFGVSCCCKTGDRRVAQLRHELQALHDTWTARVFGDRAIAGSADQFSLMCQHYMVRATEREACARDLADRLAREDKS